MLKTQRCCACRRRKPVEDFHHDYGKYGGRRKRARRCRACQSAYARAWRMRNAAALREKKRQWAAAHPWDYKAWRMNHRVRRYFAVGLGEVSGADLESVWGDGMCAYCPAPAATFDHVVPLERGGSNTRDNLAPCCRRCNCSKKALTPPEWERWKAATAQLPAGQRRRTTLASRRLARQDQFSDRAAKPRRRVP